MSNDLLTAALACVKAGVSIVPIDHTTKRPATELLPGGKWRPYQCTIADEATVRRWIASGIQSFAVVAGRVSGGLLVLDFDAPGFFERWCEGVGELAHALPVQQTGGGGYQVLLRCPDPGGNDKLAWTPDEQEDSGRTIAIETRGEGGYAVVAPSLHPSGNQYKWLNHLTAGDVVTVTQGHAEKLLAAARALDEAPRTVQEQERLEAKARAVHRQRHASNNGQASVIDAFNRVHSIDAILEGHGYAKGRTGRHMRPGGTSESVSVKDGRTYHWSSNDPLNDGKAHDAFDVFTHFDHAGDVSAAVKSAAELMGMKPGKQTKGKGKPAAAPSVEPYRPFPVDMLPGVAQRFVNEGAKALGCDASFIALPLLAELASAIGNSRRIRLKASWTEPPVLWCVIVGDSGTLKSPAFDLALRPIRLRQKRAMKQYKQALAEHAEAMEQFDDDLKAWRKAKPDERGERPKEPEQPTCERLWCSDTTVEALADRLSIAPRGLLVARDELAGWLGSFNQYKQGQGGDVAHWLEMHRAGALLVDRKTGDKTTIHVDRAAVGIAGGIQPDTLRRCLTPEFFDNGLAARLLLAMPPKRVKRWTEADIAVKTLNAVGTLFTELLSFQPSTDIDGEPEPADIGLTDGAKDVWVRFYNDHAQQQAELAGELSAAWSKLEGYAARLALVVHCIRQASKDGVNPWHADEQSMAAGVALAEWFGHEAKRVYAMLAESQDDREARELLNWVKQRGGQVTVRELTHGLRRYRGNAEQAEADLERLAEAKLGRWQTVRQNPTGGRQPRIFHLLNVTESCEPDAVTGVTVTETRVNGSAAEGSGDGDNGEAGPEVGRGDDVASEDEYDRSERDAIQEPGM